MHTWGTHTTWPLARDAHADSPARRLCLNQSAYELHELSSGQSPAADDLAPRHLRTPHSIEAARFLRSHIDLSHSAGDPRFHAEEKKRDEIGVVVAFELNGELVGTVRAVPFGHGLTLVEGLRRQAGAEPGDTYVNGWEMGRLVISPGYRGRPGVGPGLPVSVAELPARDVASR